MTLFQLYIRYKCRNMTEEEMDPRLKALLKGSWDGNLLNIPHFYECDAIAYAALKRPLRCNCGITTLAGHEPGRLFHFLAFRRKAYARYMGRAIHPVLRWKALKGKRSRLRLWFREMVWDRFRKYAASQPPVSDRPQQGISASKVPEFFISRMTVHFFS